MSQTDHLIEQQILKHESHLKHVDELFERARQASEEGPEPDPLLAALERERNDLARLLSTMQDEPPHTWEEAAETRFGPLAIWEVIARLLEHSIERLEKRT